MKKYALSDEKRRRCFLRELHSLSHVAHPNVVQIKGFFLEADNTIAYVVLHSEGRQTLRDWISINQQQKERTESDICRIMYGLLRALEAVHARGITHADVKPENVMIRPDGSPVLIDFDVACNRESLFTTRTLS